MFRYAVLLAAGCFVLLASGPAKAEKVGLMACWWIEWTHPKPPEFCQPVCEPRSYVPCKPEAGRRSAKACTKWRCTRKWW
jgi:hypothetical protein